ncbi:hypothetical protein [Siphonobacter curvatus]|uniref:PKD domain-containing protein n=1 Tax=Siphonobacter curvatus TaxID=2094562 RepID=A0A2S7IH66_9BACT|nr:hypothetical protein [Siphonobacter curvatus]PQA55130.1 hypothetical protein C5O19_21565 [Siphonobacter curvatus]
MQKEDKYWLQYRLEIEKKLAWGPSDSWQNSDFEVLSEQIFDQTQVRLSTSTLRRLWGRVRYDHLPSITTLNTLAKYLGHADWRIFRQFVDQNQQTDPPAHQPARRLFYRTKWRQYIWIISGLFLTGLLVTYVMYDRLQPNQHPTYRFASRAITRSIPNSVVFSYDASAASTDSIFIQQSWDPSRRQRVDRQAHAFTSLYYYPGTYEARLLVGTHTVRKHTVVIPTEGWLALIDRKPVPIYLAKSAIGDAAGLNVSLETIQANGIPLQPDPPAVHYYNVGNFEPVSTDDFNFSCQLKNTYGQGAGICQHTSVVLFTEGSAISIPLSQNGCISSLKLFAIDTLINGQSTDLSSFGTTYKDWVKVSCKGNKRFLLFYMNDQLIFQLPAPKYASKIVGLGYGFEGTGAIRQIRLLTGKQTIYQAFNQ